MKQFFNMGLWQVLLKGNRVLGAYMLYRCHTMEIITSGGRGDNAGRGQGVCIANVYDTYYLGNYSDYKECYTRANAKNLREYPQGER